VEIWDEAFASIIEKAGVGWRNPLDLRDIPDFILLLIPRRHTEEGIGEQRLRY
jgi:hypothetical protein